MDIIPTEHDSVDVSPPEPVPAPVAEVTEPRIEIPCTTEEPAEIEESFTASRARPGANPVVLEAPVEITLRPGPEVSWRFDREPRRGDGPGDVSSRCFQPATVYPGRA